MGNIWQWNKTNLLSSRLLWCHKKNCFVFFSVLRPVSPNLGYITSVDCTNSLPSALEMLFKIQTALVNPKFGLVWDLKKPKKTLKIHFPSKVSTRRKISFVSVLAEKRESAKEGENRCIIQNAEESPPSEGGAAEGPGWNRKRDGAQIGSFGLPVVWLRHRSSKAR